MEKNKNFENFGSLVFNEKVMKECLPYPIYRKWQQAVSKEDSLDQSTADAIAHAMKQWAIDLGATHFTHWFQPLTGSTAEKHDSFIEPDEHGDPLVRFSGKSLIKGEPDASSFPNGGLRATFEARGYTYWDCTSPAFIKDQILCIPSVFVSYTGESLDKKAPLLKSIEAINKSATRVVNLLGEKDIKQVFPMVGLEQEYFLVDLDLFNKRLDLKFTGRTLFGSNPAKRQEFDSHYFGNIPTRVLAFMKEVNQELWKLGIYAKAEHNEAAPAQFELAPLFSPCNIAVDQNQLVMHTLDKIARKHHFACLLHEKPFVGLNGSGKHNNWSLCTDNGQNLFSPGEKPAENIRFLLFIAAFIRAVDTHAELLRMAASSAGNDHRLGANEAPPAIISIYLGEYIENILFNLTSKNNKDSGEFSPIHGLSYIPRDNTDRNRTSPMAFTGNKFEFRMLGSSQSASTVNTILNTAMAQSLDELAENLEGIKYVQDIREKALALSQAIFQKHKRILFSGDGYSSKWVEEAKKRGLSNIPDYIESTEALVSKKSIKLLTSYSIFSEKELHARYDILNKLYCNSIEVEVRILLQLIRRDFLPLLLQEIKECGSTAINLSNPPSYLIQRISLLSSLMDQLDQEGHDLYQAFEDIHQLKNIHDQGLKIARIICPLMLQIRKKLDEIEKISSSGLYPFPVYGELLFGND